MITKPDMTPNGQPPTEDVSALLNTVFNAPTSQASLDASYALTDLLLNTVGFRGLDYYGVLREIKQAAGDKKSGMRRESAMILLGALYEKLPRKQPVAEFIFLQLDGLVSAAIDALADKGAVVRESAQYAMDALFANLESEALVIGLLPVLMDYLGRKSSKWQGTVAALELMGRMAEKAKIGMDAEDVAESKDALRASMGKRLPKLIPLVEDGMHDLKAEVSRENPCALEFDFTAMLPLPCWCSALRTNIARQVSKQALKTMTSLTTLLTNDDVAPRIPLLIQTMQNPSAATLQKAIHALSQTTFVAVVTSPVLALLTPLLERSLNTPTTPQEVLRQTVVVVENLTKLVHDPVEARTFLPKLKPGVKGVQTRASLPEVRELAQRASDVIDKAMGDDSKGVGGGIVPTSVQDVLIVLEETLKSRELAMGRPDENAFMLSLKEYIASMVCEDVQLRMHSRIMRSIEPYISQVVEGKEVAPAVAKAVQEHFVQEDHRKFGEPESEKSDDIEIVNTNFSLAYGGMLLLSHTNLRLLKGHRYGLCGRNGAGKSTLMRSIAEGKLEGFPCKDELKTCFVEHNQGEDADLSIIEFVSKDPELATTGRDRISEVLSEVGFTAGPGGRQEQKVGSLSGGWKMKLALARAMLMGADVLLLDEPTNHLDVGNVKWLQKYLKQHTEITSLIVSHDSAFLDEVCTDIYHYETKKLVCYKGNLAR